MLLDFDLKGGELSDHTLSLTYDDGPGPGTRELGRFLHEEGIQAAFFVIGQVAAERIDLLEQLRDWGHLIGNHTWSHPGLFDLAKAGGEVVAEVERADALIRHVVRPPFYLRPPYGSWRAKSHPQGPEDAPESLVAQILRGSRRFNDYVGPVMWDIMGEDWEYWRRGDSVEDCFLRHLSEIEKGGRGIVLMHDSSEDPRLREANRTMEMTKMLVPALKERNYRFVRVDAAIHL